MENQKGAALLPRDFQKTRVTRLSASEVVSHQRVSRSGLLGIHEVYKARDPNTRSNQNTYQPTLSL